MKRAVIPPREIPSNLLESYSMNGQIEIIHRYYNETAELERVYTFEDVEAKIAAARRQEIGYYQITDKWLYQALNQYSIKDKQVVVYGSQIPWYEAICLAHNAQCTTIEYQKITSMHPGIQTITPAEYEKNPVKFDAAISVSSFEHDGLGRYGDPLNPNGDLEAMNKAQSSLVAGGILFLSVPCSTQDVLVWNAHRIYGPKRLPLLLNGWRLLGTFGIIHNGGGEGYSQPIFVLERD